MGAINIRTEILELSGLSVTFELKLFPCLLEDDAVTQVSGLATFRGIEICQPWYQSWKLDGFYYLVSQLICWNLSQRKYEISGMRLY